MFQHTLPHLCCHLIDSEQRKLLSGSGSGAQLDLSSKPNAEFPVTVRAGGFSHCVAVGTVGKLPGWGTQGQLVCFRGLLNPIVAMAEMHIGN